MHVCSRCGRFVSPSLRSKALKCNCDNNTGFTDDTVESIATV